VRVDTIPPAAAYENRARWTFNYVSCQGQPSRSGVMVTDPVTTPIARIEAAKAVEPASLQTNQTAIFTVTVSNTGTARSSGVTLTDPIPPGLTYVPGTTRLNTVPVPDVAGAMPFAAGRAVNSPGLAAGEIDPGHFAVVTFQVRAAPNTQGMVTNTATIEPDGTPGGLPPFQVSAPVNVTPIADLEINKTGPAMATPGTNIAYTLTVNEQWTVQRRRRDGHRPDPGGADIRQQCRRLHDALPVQPRAARRGCITDHHHHLLGAARFRVGRSDPEHGDGRGANAPDDRSRPRQQHEHGADRDRSAGRGPRRDEDERSDHGRPWRIAHLHPSW
jgi:uncharacterized repeat protein (TIGR01451 family)